MSTISSLLAAPLRVLDATLHFTRSRVTRSGTRRFLIGDGVGWEDTGADTDWLSGPLCPNHRTLLLYEAALVSRTKWWSAPRQVSATDLADSRYQGRLICAEGGGEESFFLTSSRSIDEARARMTRRFLSLRQGVSEMEVDLPEYVKARRASRSKSDQPARRARD